MRGAIGNAWVMNIVITFIIITVAFLVGSISYTKAFKIKTKVVDLVEKHNGDFSASYTGTDRSILLNEIELFLGQTGYRVTPNSKCSKKDKATLVGTTTNYDLCIYKYDDDGNSTYRGSYYEVTVYMYFDVPIIGDVLKIPVSGQTSTMFQEIDI